MNGCIDLVNKNRTLKKQRQLAQLSYQLHPQHFVIVQAEDGYYDYMTKEQYDNKGLILQIVEEIY